MIQKIGKAVKEVARLKDTDWWYTPHMAAASRAIADRIPLVDLVLEVRDARIPLSSECVLVRNIPSLRRHIVVLNKTDLANSSQTKEWMAFFEEKQCRAFAVNSHNKDNIKEFLNFLQAKVKELKMMDHSTVTVMLVGIPNVGKSALANSLHQVGRICASEKGKLKHATVSPHPGETKSISSLKIASHPNIYILDTPGILSPEVMDDDVCSKLALTGAIKDCVVGEVTLAQYFLSILNTSDEYKKWEKLYANEKSEISTKQGISNSASSQPDRRKKRQYPTDHTQDFIVNDVRRSLFEAISSYSGNMEKGGDSTQLMEAEFERLKKVFRLPTELDDDNYDRVAIKLLNLYRTGRLGHYTLDPAPRISEAVSD